jgi:three-Cys-motif partner protein
MELKPRDTQTQVKHKILAEYLDTWGGIILNPRMRSQAKQQQRPDPHFVYVDCFSSIGRYAGNKHRSSDIVEGSPIIGIRALDKLAEHARKYDLPVRVNSVLIEKDQKAYQGLQDTLSNYGYANRTQETVDFSNLRSGEIAILNADSITLVDRLLAYTTSGVTWAFYLLDPYGPGIPHNFVNPIVRQKRHDVMINFIYEDLSRKVGMARSDKVGAQQRQQVENWTAVFGDEEWKNAEQEVRQAMRQSTETSDNEESKCVERALVDRYDNVLRRMDPTLAVKLVDLQFPEKERTMFYLFLTTHDPTGALSLNKILYNAKLWEQEIRSVRRLSKEMEETGQMAFFSAQEHLAEPTAPPRPTKEAIASDILQRFSGKTTTRREVYRELVNEEYFPEEIDKALSLLKKRGRAQFEGSLSPDKPPIQFSKF